ncbi:hypothetical protein TrRE_jg3576, partial [Triparma retinervis]
MISTSSVTANVRRSARLLDLQRDTSRTLPLPAPVTADPWPEDLLPSDLPSPTITPNTTDLSQHKDLLATLERWTNAANIHAVLGHRHKNSLLLMYKHNSLSDLPPIGALSKGSPCVCAACLAAKIRRRNTKARIHLLPTTTKRRHLSFDRFTSPVRSINGMKYGIFMIDNLTKYLWIWLLATKTELEFSSIVINGPNGIINILKRTSDNLHGAHVTILDDPSISDGMVIPTPDHSETAADNNSYFPVYAGQPSTGIHAPLGAVGSHDRSLHTDNEKTFLTSLVTSSLARHGVSVTTTATHTPSDNAFVERVQGTIANSVRTSLIYAQAPLELWSDHMPCAVMAYNVCLHSAHSKAKNLPFSTGLTPYELDKGFKPSYKRLHIPSSPGFCWTRPEAPTADEPTKQKWKPRGKACIFAYYYDKTGLLDGKVWVRETDGRSLKELVADKSSSFHIPRVAELPDAGALQVEAEHALSLVSPPLLLSRSPLAILTEVPAVAVAVAVGARVKTVDAQVETEPHLVTGTDKFSAPLSSKFRSTLLVESSSTLTTLMSQLLSIANLLQHLKVTRRTFVQDIFNAWTDTSQSLNSRHRATSGTTATAPILSGVQPNKLLHYSTLEHQRSYNDYLGLRNPDADNALYRASCDNAFLPSNFSRPGWGESSYLDADGPQPSDSSFALESLEIAPTNRETADNLNAFSANFFSSRPSPAPPAVPHSITDCDVIIQGELPFTGARHRLLRNSDFKEFSGLITSRAVTPVVLSPEQQSTVPIIDIMVVRKFKVTTNATVFIGKSRLVPRGDKIPYNDGSSSTAHLPFKPLTYAPTIPTEAKRVFFCIASAHGRDILQIDFIQAFGQPKFKANDKRYYLKVPLRYRQHGIASLFTDYLDDSNPHAVSRTTATNLATPAASSIFLRLNAYLYGLPDAARQWWLLLSTALLDLNFVQHSTWNCFFRKEEPDNSVTFLIVHVDDMLGHNSKDVSKVNEAYTAIRKTLKATDPIPLHGNLFLNVRYFRNADLSWSCSQEHYIDSIKERFPQHPISRKLPYTQLPPDFNLGPSLRSVTKEAVHQLELEFGCKFSAITGSAVYLLDTREDCRTSIVFLASHNHLPGRSHFIAAFHFLNYLYATKSLRFNFSKPYA